MKTEIIEEKRHLIGDTQLFDCVHSIKRFF